MDSNGFNQEQQTGGYQQPYSNPNDGYTGSNNSGLYGGNPEEGKAPNIFQQFAFAFVPPQYGRLAKVKVGSMIGFVTLLTLIATIISAANQFIRFNFTKEVEAVLDVVPDFEVKHGRFSIDEEFMYEDSGIFVYLTEDIDEFTYDDASYLGELGYTNVFLVGSRNFCMMQNREYQEYKFSDLGSGVEFNKDWILDSLMPILQICIIAGYVVFFIGRTLWYFFCAMLYFLVALIVAQIMHKKVSAGALYKTAVYSKVLMFVLAVLFGLIPFMNAGVPGLIRIILTIAFMSVCVWKLPENV